VRIGIDLGGTKIEVIALDNDGGELFRKRVPTPRHDYQQTLNAITGLVLDAEAATGKKGSVGLGIPGTISPFTGKVKNANSTWLNGQPLDKDLEAMLDRPVRIANDANCLAVSEALMAPVRAVKWYLLSSSAPVVVLALPSMAACMPVVTVLPVNSVITRCRGSTRTSGTTKTSRRVIAAKRLHRDLCVGHRFCQQL
jgi:N-acetylglucosamine kinase (EC 2.7.1.59)